MLTVHKTKQRDDWGGNSTREVQKTRHVNLRIRGLKKNSVSILEKILPSVR